MILGRLLQDLIYQGAWTSRWCAGWNTMAWPRGAQRPIYGARLRRAQRGSYESRAHRGLALKPGDIDGIRFWKPGALVSYRRHFCPLSRRPRSYLGSYAGSRRHGTIVSYDELPRVLVESHAAKTSAGRKSPHRAARRRDARNEEDFSRRLARRA